MSLSKESIKRLRQVKRAILAEPEFYDQGVPPDECATTCCIAGWAMWLEDPVGYPERAASISNSFNCSDGTTQIGFRNEGARALRIPEPETVNLFSYGEAWPGEFGTRFAAAASKAEKAAVAAARIEHFIKTGGAK
jgi:hypothetical protein